MLALLDSPAAVANAGVRGTSNNAGVPASTRHVTRAIVVVAILLVQVVPLVRRGVVSVLQVRLLAEMRASTSRVTRSIVGPVGSLAAWDKSASPAHAGVPIVPACVTDSASTYAPITTIVGLAATTAGKTSALRISASVIAPTR